MIEVRCLSKQFEQICAVAQTSFTVADQAWVVLVGDSGSGKTTLLRLIAGLEMPDDGEIYLNGQLASRPGWVLPPYQRRVGFVFQTPALWPHLTVAQNISFGINAVSKVQARQRLAEVLKQTGLQQLAKRYPAQLSGGETRRVALARTLAPRPQHLLLDEPLTNLDPKGRNEMLSLVLQAAQSYGADLIYVTHDPTEASQISPCPLIMNRGRIAAQNQTHPGDADNSGCAPAPLDEAR